MSCSRNKLGLEIRDRLILKEKKKSDFFLPENSADTDRKQLGMGVFMIIFFISENKADCYRLINHTFIQVFRAKANSMLTVSEANFEENWMTTMFTICSANCVAN